MEQELDGAERGPAGQCGPGWEAETCPWLPSPGRASWSQARPAQGVDLSSARKQGIQAGWPWPTVASAPGPHPRRLPHAHRGQGVGGGCGLFHMRLPGASPSPHCPGPMHLASVTWGDCGPLPRLWTPAL